MKKLKYLVKKFFLSDTLPFGERILNFACFLGASAAIVALFARVIEGMALINIMAMFFMFITVVALFLASALRFKYAETFKIVVVYGLGLGFFPFVFFNNGGAHSGMAAYFVMAIILDFLLLTGKVRSVALILTSAVIAFSYVATQYLGWPVLPEGGLNNFQLFVDSIQSIFVTGFFMGAVIVFQNNVYLNEKRKAEERLVQQQLMSSISESFISKEPMDTLIGDALTRMGAFFNVERILIAVFEENSGTNRCEYYWSADEKYIPGAWQNAWQNEFCAVLQSVFLHKNQTGFTQGREGIFCGNTATYEGGMFRVFHEHNGLKSFICVPIHVDGRLWGMMSIEEYKKFRQWNESDAQLVNTVAIAISNALARDIIEKERAAALKDAVQASRAKSDFLSNMSHEMRTPMNAIIGMTSIGMSATNIDRMKYYFSKIDNASKHLLGVINDVLDMSKIEANKFELSPISFEFEKMLQKVVNVINFRVDEKKQKLYVNIGGNIPRFLIGDDQRFSQVIANLLSNAVKFTPEEGVIHLDADLVAEKDGMCRLQISVTDTGIGITSEQKARLFNAFGQAEAGISRKFGGTGLGLAISKKIVAMMGGDIWVESEHEKGSKFTFTVLLKRDFGEQKHLLPGNINWGNIRMFVVDDDPEIRDFFMNVSANMGIFCETATSGEEARKKLAADDNYNIYLIDWKLPGISGIELIRQIHLKSAQKTAAILFSSTDWDLIEDEARGAGVDMFLQKPLFQSDIVNLINKCIGDVAEYNETGEYAHDFSGHTILLAEDVEINREIVLTLLEPTGLTIECAENGLQAVDMFKEAPDKYDMVFMDMQMPKMDGCEATRQIRRLDHPKAQTIPIIAMTANVFKEDIDNCLAAGMNDHIGKPLIIDIVHEKLRKFLFQR